MNDTVKFLRKLGGTFGNELANEILELEEEIARVTGEFNAFQSSVGGLLAEQEVEIDRLRALLAVAKRAAQPENAEVAGVAPTQGSDFVWGATDIGRVINRNTRQTNYMLDRGIIKSARKVGGQWAASRSSLIREMSGEQG